MTDKGEKLSVVSVYAPTLTRTNKSQEDYSAFLDSLEVATLHVSEGSPKILIGGDFNTMISEALDSCGKVTNRPELIIDLIEELMGKYGLLDAFRALHPNEKTFTFAPLGQNKGEIYNRLDYVWGTPDILNKIKEVKYVHIGKTDHKGVEISLGPPENLPGLKPGLWRHNDELNSNRDFIEKTMATIDQELKSLDPGVNEWEY